MKDDGHKMKSKIVYKFFCLLAAIFIYFYGVFISSLDLEEYVILFMMYAFFFHWIFQYLFGYKMYGPLMGMLVNGANDVLRMYLFGLSIFMCFMIIRSMVS